MHFRGVTGAFQEFLRVIGSVTGDPKWIQRGFRRIFEGLSSVHGVLREFQSTVIDNTFCITALSFGGILEVF